MKPADLVFFTLASQSGMGRFATELAEAAARIENTTVLFIAPPMEHEPIGCQRVILPLPTQNFGRVIKLLSMLWMSIAGCYAVMRHAQSGTPFVMIELGSTAPISVLPAVVARLRGMVSVLNLHDFYPHSFRFGLRLRKLEKAAYRWCYRRFDLIAAMKPPQRDRLQAEAKVDPNRVFTIEHGPFLIQGVRPPNVGAGVVRVLVLGTLRKNKMILETIRAVSNLQSAGVNITLRIAGKSSLQDCSYWAQCQQELGGIAGAEVMDRYIADSEMPLVLSDVDAIVCPYEGFDSQSGVSIVAVSNGIGLIATASATVSNASANDISISTPVTAANIAQALTAFAALPMADRQARALALKHEFEQRGIWDAGAKAILHRAQQYSDRDGDLMFGADAELAAKDIRPIAKGLAKDRLE
jgi:glycosyltransferase involved in cell wall biosynthesis